MSAFSSISSKSQLRSVIDPLLVKATDIENNIESSAPGVIFGVTNDKETVYLNHHGVREIGTKNFVSNDTQFHYFSTSKPVTSLAVLQLLDQGKLELDTPAKKYLPEIADIKLVKKTENGTGIELVEPKNDITIRHLLTHTSGLSYAFFSPEYVQLYKENGIEFTDPKTNWLEYSYLIAEPGALFSYGVNLEWAGRLIEVVSGQKLGEYFEEHIFKPAGIKNTVVYADLNDENYLRLHQRAKDGSISVAESQPPRVPFHERGGEALIGTVDDFLKFIRIWLNKGKTSEGVQIISEKIWALAIENALPTGIETRHIKSYFPESIKELDTNSRSAKRDTWTLAFARNEVRHITGRPTGSLYWKGIGNTFFWIDLENKIGGYYATEIFPGGDSSSENNDIIETAVYDALKN